MAEIVAQAWEAKMESERKCIYDGFHVTRAGEDYLERILILQNEEGMVRSIDLSRHMGVTKPSVSNAVKFLREGGFLTMDEGGFLHLTDIGREIAEKIFERHRLLSAGLVKLGVDPVQAEQDACRIEHVISDESFEKLKPILHGSRK